MPRFTAAIKPRAFRIENRESMSGTGTLPAHSARLSSRFSGIGPYCISLIFSDRDHRRLHKSTLQVEDSKMQTSVQSPFSNLLPAMWICAISYDRDLKISLCLKPKHLFHRLRV